MANGFTVQMAYAWSRAMTESGYLNDSDTELERVISQWDREHTFVSSGLVEMPFGRNRRFGRDWGGVTNAVLGGWQISYIFKAQSGAPLGFGNFLFAEGMGVGDIAISNPSVDHWVSVNAFNRVSAQQLVSNLRTQPSRFAEVRGPGYAVLDLGLLKNFSLGGTRQVQFRLEAYNATNRANLQNPSTTTTSTALGTITAQNGLPRQLQLAVRVSFQGTFQKPSVVSGFSRTATWATAALRPNRRKGEGDLSFSFLLRDLDKLRMPRASG